MRAAGSPWWRRGAAGLHGRERATAVGAQGASTAGARARDDGARGRDWQLPISSGFADSELGGVRCQESKEEVAGKVVWSLGDKTSRTSWSTALCEANLTRGNLKRVLQRWTQIPVSTALDWIEGNRQPQLELLTRGWGRQGVLFTRWSHPKPSQILTQALQ
jgi:hypothetical protein